MIEGKQRITTLQKYKGDKFPLSKKLDPVIVDGETYEIAGKRFSQLDEVVQDKLLNSEVLIFEMWDCTEKRSKRYVCASEQWKAFKWSPDPDRSFKY